jgi:hypothetical protein
MRVALRTGANFRTIARTGTLKTFKIPPATPKSGPGPATVATVATLLDR